jgi:chromosome partitioning protein
MHMIGVVSQKGGVGKSTLAREIARQFAFGKWRVKIADLDTKQTTSADWNAIRREAHIQPDISVEAFSDPTQVTGLADFDLLVFDGKPHSDKQTRRIAEMVDLVVIPTGTTRDDLTPQLKLAYELEDIAKVSRRKVIFVLNNVIDVQAPEVAFARSTIVGAGYDVVSTPIPRRIAYQNAQNVGRSLSEVSHPGLAETASKAVEEIVARMMNKEAA